MILALGFDPFIQNLVHYDTVYIPDPERTSSIVTANEFDIPEVFGQLGSDAKGRIQSGMYSVSSSLRVPTYSCDTGNCTWIGYNTLGVGVHCADLTSDLVRTCSNETALQVCDDLFFDKIGEHIHLIETGSTTRTYRSSLEFCPWCALQLPPPKRNESRHR